MSLSNNDNRDPTDDDPELRMPYRKRRRFYETPPQPLEKWREACYRAHPDLDSHSEADKEAIESRFKVAYYIALGLDSSLPRTATSGSIETPKVSPLLQRPSRVPSRTSPAPATPARPIEPVGLLQPLTVLPNHPLQPHFSPILPVPPLAQLLPHSSNSTLSQLLLEPLAPLVTTNPYLSSFYPPYEKPLITSGTVKPLQDTFVKSTEEPYSKSERTPRLKEEEHFLRTDYNNPPPSTVKDDCFIKPLRPVSKPYRDTFLESFKKSSSTSSNKTSIGDAFIGSAASSSSYYGSAKSSHRKRKRRELLLEPTADPFKRISISQTEREPYRYSRQTVRKSSEDRDIKSYPFFEPIEHLSSYREPYTKIDDPFVKKPRPLESFYNPSTTGFSIPKLAQSSSLYVDCPPVYPTIAYIDLGEEISDNNNDVSVSNNNNNNEANDEPIDYSLNHPPDLYP